MTSNGTGLGHLTRAMAIARRLETGLRPAILTMSAAAPVARDAGFHVEYFPSYTAPAAESKRRWDRRLSRRLGLLLDELRPSVLVFDGAHPYLALVKTLRSQRPPGMAAVWSRRPMWQPGIGAEALSWTAEFDAVLEPGELAETEDRGLTVGRRAEAMRVGPVLYSEPHEGLDRAAAERELGLDPGRVHALVQLGQGPEVKAAVRRCLERLSDADVQVATLESSLSPPLTLPDGFVHLRDTYPVSRYLAAFDLAVSAVGYNGFHELLAFGVPTVFVPMPRQLDDQAARARWAERQGLALAVDGPGSPDLEAKLSQLLDESRRRAIAEQLRDLEMENGAAKAASLVAGLAGATPAGGARIAAPERVSERGRFTRQDPRGRGNGPRQDPPPNGTGPRQAPPSSRRRAALSVTWRLLTRQPLWRLPTIAWRQLTERWRNPPPPPARAVLGAVGLRGADLEAAIERGLGEVGEDPARVLVITDSVEFGLLRRLGVAWEYVPSREDAEKHLGVTDYEPFLRHRTDAALDVRRRPRRTLDLSV